MAYRRRQGIGRTSTFKEEIYNSLPPPPSDDTSTTSSSSSSSQSLAAQAIRASAARRGSNLYSYHHKSSSDPLSFSEGRAYDYTSSRTTKDPAGSFWGVLARKAKSILDEDNTSQQFAEPTQIRYNTSYYKNDPYYYPYQSLESSRAVDNPTIRRGLDRITSSINQIGGTIGNAFEEGRSMVENKTADFIQETRKMQIGRKGTNAEECAPGVSKAWQELRYSAQPWMQSNQQTQLKASRDVAMATAAKAKLLLRELKTVKADLAFAKQRCSQLEEENKILREAYEKGDHPADDDMIRLQLETLLAEKARLAHENSVFARENRFLREIVEYHQLTMQDVVYLDEGIEEVTEVYSVPAVSRMLSVCPPLPGSPTPEKSSPLRSPEAAKESPNSPIRLHANSSQTDSSPTPASAPSQLQMQDVSGDTTPAPIQLQAVADVPESEAPPGSNSPVSSPIGTTEQRNFSA